MDPNDQGESSEKTRLRQNYEASSPRPPLLSPTTGTVSSNSSGGGGCGGGGVSPMGSSSVPMSEDELTEAELGSQFEPSSPSLNVRSPTPPPYSGPSTSTPHEPRPQHKGPQRYPGLPLLDYRLYSPPLFIPSGDHTTIRSTAPYLSSNASALAALVRSQSTVPPKPQIHIVGKRGSKLDFDIKLNLMNLLVPEDMRQRMDYIRCVADGELAMRGGVKPSLEPEVGDGGLDEWCRRFVEDSGSVKTFTLERVVANMDINWLEGQIRSMVASTGYKGLVTITFPVSHAKVVVQNPDKVNKFFTSVATLFAGKKKYEVAKAVWPFATHKNGEPGRRCIVQSEETWWREWKDPIRYAIATKREGWVTNEDKLEAIMEGTGKAPTMDWGPEY